jgi:hypothetical protein
MSEPQIPVKYIGPDAYWEGLLYGVKLRFEGGQTRALPESLALKFLTHQDTFQRDESVTVAPKTPEQETADALAQAEQQQKDEHDQYLDLHDVLDRVNLMGKDQLSDFASRYGTKLDRRLSVEKLRGDVKQLIDLNGLI